MSVRFCVDPEAEALMFMRYGIRWNGGLLEVGVENHSGQRQSTLYTRRAVTVLVWVDIRRNPVFLQISGSVLPTEPCKLT